MTTVRQFPLPPTCDVRVVTELFGRLNAELTTGDTLVIDASAVERCDTCVAQLFVVVSRERRVSWKLSATLKQHLAQLALPPTLFTEGGHP